MQCKVDDFILSASALSSPCLDLSRKGIRELPEEMPGCENLEVRRGGASTIDTIDYVTRLRSL